MPTYSRPEGSNLKPVDAPKLKRGGKAKVYEVPIDQLRDMLDGGQTRLEDIERHLGQWYEERQIRSAFFALLKDGEIEAFPIGDVVTVRLVGDGGSRRAQS